MIRKLTFYLIALAIILVFVSCRKGDPPDAGKKTPWSYFSHSKRPIHFDKNYYVALWWHGYRQLGLFDKPMNPECALWLDQLSPLLSEFRSPAPLLDGALHKILCQFPTYLDPSNPEELEKIMSVTKQFIREGSITVFTDEWPQMTRYWDQWFCEPSIEMMISSLDGREETVFQVMDIWTAYMKALWPKYEKTFQKEISQYPFEAYQAICDTLDLLEFWEKQFFAKYPYEKMSIIVCPECPTLAARIGPEKIVVGAQYSWDILRNAIVHEVGFRFSSLHRLSQLPETSDIVSEDFAGVTRLIEAEVCVRKLDLLKDITGDAYVTSLNLQNLVNWMAIMKMDTTLEASIPLLYPKAKDAKLL